MPNNSRPGAADNLMMFTYPVHILKLNNSGSVASKADEADRELVTFSNVLCCGDNLLIQVETTAPPPKRRSRRTHHQRFRAATTGPEVLANLGSPPNVRFGMPDATDSSGGATGLRLHSATTSSHDSRGEEASDEASECDTMGTIPTWIRRELRDSAPPVSQPLSSPSKSVPPPVAKKLSQSSGGKWTEESVEKRNSSSDLDTTDGSARGSISSGAGAAALPVKRHSRLPPAASYSMQQKPLNKLRMQNKGKGTGVRRSKEGVETGQTDDIRSLIAEKESAERRLKTLEVSTRSDVVKSKEREKALLDEISSLRGELNRQNQMFRQNQDVVIALQEQLLQLQNEQARLAQEAMLETKRKAESRICSVQ